MNVWVILVAVSMIGVVVANPTTSHQVYHVRPENGTKLYDGHSRTFDYYVWRNKEYFKSNSKFVFQPGTHFLNSALLIEYVRNLELIGSGNCTVRCLGPYGFIIVNSSNVKIENLAIIDCGQRIESIAPSTRAALAFDMVHNLTFSKVTVHGSKGFGIYSNRVFGTFLIKSSTFTFNQGSTDFSGGNAMIYYQNCSTVHTASESYLTINSSQFINGKNAKSFPASGLTLWLGCTNISARISNSNFSHNIGFLDYYSSTGGNLAIFYRNYTNITTNRVTVEYCYISHGHANTGAGMYVTFLETPELKPTAGNFGNRQIQATQTLNISNTHFISNSATRVGAGLYIITHEMLGMMADVSGIIIIQNCNFSKNYLSPGKGGAALYILNQFLPGYMQHSTPQFNMSIIGCTFSESFVKKYPYHEQRWSGGTSAVSLSKTHSGVIVTFTGCVFESNVCSALVAVQSTIIFQGENTFKNNTDTHGGGLVLGENSQMYLKPNTTVAFINNHAHSVGGGIYVQDENLLSTTMCFFELDYSVTESEKLLDTIAIVMVNNTADLAGNAIYGGSIDRCFMYAPLAWKRYWHFMTKVRTVFNQLFHIFPNDSLSVTSNPSGVCFCNSSHIPDCNKKTYELVKFPGETFNVSMVTVGQLNGIVPGKVLATLINGSVFANPNQYLQEINNTQCNSLSYSVHSKQESETIVLTPLQTINSSASKYPTNISLSLKPCPLGFSLAHDPPYCDCAPLLSRDFKCSISDQTIHRHSSAWVSVVKTENGTDNILIKYQKHCPEYYCKDNKVCIKTSNETFDTDEQCAFNRTGILCGACREGLSSVLGSSKCLKCSNYYLLILLLAFALTGIVLVFLLTACNLTVTEGTINGLIFYCNIISSNQRLFFTFASSKPQDLSCALLINWVNLELGISTCFYDGMDAYAKAWLQFVFPIYIWTIAAAIVFLSGRYATIARLMGRNAVKVLATLMLISYASLLQSVIGALRYTSLTYSDGSSKLVWYYDGSIEYAKGKHILLFTAAVMVLIVSLTYTAILASVQCLRKCNARICSWVPRFKPFFDAYTGPYKDSYQFWTGHLLMIRIIILLAYTFNTYGHPSVKLLLIISACAHLLLLNVWVARGVYKKWPLDVLESSSFLNLGILSAATAYVNKNGGNQMAVTITSLHVALVTFIGVLLYHMYKLIASTRAWRVLSTWLVQKLKPAAEIVEEPIAIAAGETETLLPPVVHFDQYREPLLYLGD